MELITPYGGKLVSLIAEGEEKSELTRRAAELSSLQLTARTLCDLELLATGALSPLDRFMGKADAERVAAQMRLAGGTLFPIPITLQADRIDGIAGKEIALRTPKNNLAGWMKVEEVYEWSYEAEAFEVCGTIDGRHPLVAEMRTWGRYRLSGPLRVIELPRHPDFPSLRRTPAEVRALLASMGRGNVVAFEPRNPIHRAGEELTRRAARDVEGGLLIQPVVGMTQPGDIGHYTRVRTYNRLVENYYDPGRTLLNLLPLATRLAGPREALWHAIVQRNFGANYFLVGHDHELVTRHSAETGVRAMPPDEMVYLVDEDRYERAPALPPGARTLSLPETEVREEYLAKGRPLPEWFTRKEIAAILSNSYPPRHLRGFCIWFTGLPSSGKSTVAEALIGMLMEHGRQATMLDGDVVRTHLSKGLTFSREDRDTNILRVGFVAAEIVRHNGVAICAAVSPYRHTRNQVRAMVANHSTHDDAFIEVFVDTPAEECERRDVKGFYAQARDGKIRGFTGVDDPYEPPLAPEIRLSTTDSTAVQNAALIVEFLLTRGLLAPQSRHRAIEAR
jgi:sulfate adenylyltransferase